MSARKGDNMQAGSAIRATLAVAALLFAAACTGGGTYESTAVDLIEGDLEESIGLGSLDASCTEPATDTIGTEFVCSATAGDAGTIEFIAVIDSEDHVQVRSTNLVNAERLALIEVGAVEILNEEFDLVLPDDSIDCGAESVVLDGADSIACAFTQPETGDVYDTVITITDEANGLIEIDVAQEPRS
jgi:hypothetical protein